MRKHEITIQPDDWKETDPVEDRFVTIEWSRVESLFCIACGSRGLYTQPWDFRQESYLLCTACGVELISAGSSHLRTSTDSWARAFLAKLRELDGITEWKEAGEIEVLSAVPTTS